VETTRATYEIDRGKGLILITGLDARSPAEFEAVMREILADPNFRRGDGVICDRRGVTAPTPEVIRSAVQFVSAHPDLATSRWALIVSDVTSYGMMRMAQILASETSVDVAIFHEREPAEQWLRDAGGR
jgi:hypothetical protein